MSDRFHKLVFDVSEQLNERDHEALNYIYNLPDKNSSNLKSLRELARRGLFSSLNVDGLSSILRDINRSDLIENIETFKRCHSPSIPSQPSYCSCATEDSADLVNNIKSHFLLANNLKLRLNVLQRKHQEFLARLNEECNTLSVCQFCEEMVQHLKLLEQDVDRFFIAPPMELTDSRRGSGALGIHTARPTRLSTHSNYVHVSPGSRPLDQTAKCRSHSLHDMLALSNTDEYRDGVDSAAETAWVVIGEPHENHPRLGQKSKTLKVPTTATKTATAASEENKSKALLSWNRGQTLPVRIPQTGSLKLPGMSTKRSRIPIPVSSPQRSRHYYMYSRSCTSSPTANHIMYSPTTNHTASSIHFRSRSYDSALKLESLSVETDFLSSTDSVDSQRNYY